MSAGGLTGGHRIAWWALLAMVFIVPLAMSDFAILHDRLPLTADPFDIVKVFFLRVLTLVALAAWVWTLLRRGGTIRHTPVDWLILAFLVWVLFTTVTSIHPPTALLGSSNRYEGLLTYIDYALVYYLVLQYADTAQRRLSLAKTLCWSSVIVAAYGVSQYLGADPIHWWSPAFFEANRAFSTFGNPVLLGGLLVFGLPVALALALLEERKPWRLVYWLGFVFIATCLLATFARSAWIGGFLGLLLVCALAWRKRVRVRFVDIVPASVVGAVAAAVAWRSAGSASEVTNMGTRLSSILDFSASSGRTRTEIWQAALDAVRARPFTGWGADTFGFVFTKYTPPAYVRDAGFRSLADNAHSYPLQLAATLGVPGALLMGGIVVWTAIRTARSVFGRTDARDTLILGAFWAAAAGYLLHLMAGVSVVGTTFLLWVAFGVLLSPSARIVEFASPRRGRICALVLVGVLAVAIAYQFLPLAADHAYLTSLASENGAERISAAKRAAALNPWVGDYRAEIGLAHKAEAELYLQLAADRKGDAEASGAYMNVAVQQAALAEAAFRDAIAFSPDEVKYYVMLAQLFNLAGGALDRGLYRDATLVAREGLKRMPLSLRLRVQLARTFLGTGDTSKAIGELEYCLRVDPADGEAAVWLAGVYERQGRMRKAKAVLQSVEALLPGQAGVREALERLERAPSP